MKDDIISSIYYSFGAQGRRTEERAKYFISHVYLFTYLYLLNNMPQFSTHESVSLEKDVELKGKIIQTNPTEIDEIYEVQKCVEWIRKSGFQRVCFFI